MAKSITVRITTEEFYTYEPTDPNLSAYDNALIDLEELRSGEIDIEDLNPYEMEGDITSIYVDDWNEDED